MDDDNEELARRLARPLGQYAQLYPDIERRLVGILENRDPKVRRRIAAVAGIARQRSEARRERLMARYQLTRAEAKVAAWLADGGDIASYAKSKGISIGTVRIQLKSVFAKTGVNRQAALVKLTQTVF
jgi:DNA-binding CsgD family transcriptional regulator